MINRRNSRLNLPSPKIDLLQLGLFALLFLAVGIYATLVSAIVDNRIFVIALVGPMILVAMLTKFAPRLFTAFLVLSLAISARFRFGGMDFHTGGAEAALAPLDFALLGLLFWWAIENYRKPISFTLRFSRVEKALFILIIAQLPSLLIAPSINLAVLELLRLLKMVLLIAVLKHFIRTRRDLESVVLLVLLGIGAQGILAFVQAQFGFSLGLGFLGERDSVWEVSSGVFVASRAGGTMGHANALAHFFEMSLPLAMAVFLGSDSGRLRSPAWLAFGAGLIGLYLTLSRGGWVGALCGLAVVFLFNRQWRRLRNRRRLLVNATLIVSVLAVLGIALWPRIEQRLTEFNSVSWLFRFRTFEVAQNIIRDHFWLGVGPNNYLQVSIPYSQEILIAWPEAIVHNAYLLLFAETGIVGLVAFLWFLWNLRGHARRVIKASSPFPSAVALGVWGGIIALLVHSLVGWLFRYDPVYTLFWFNVGLLLAVGNLDEKWTASEINQAGASRLPPETT